MRLNLLDLCRDLLDLWLHLLDCLHLRWRRLDLLAVRLNVLQRGLDLMLNLHYWSLYRS